MQLFYGMPEDIENWMRLVNQISWNFPGLESQEKLDEYKATVLRFMGKMLLWKKWGIRIRNSRSLPTN